ncbi:DUF3237 domain-containing protein [Microbacterium sp. X-17]|uniref:DUF3237 domain-containing protein n=1 Tax=Microbacterium sp. X-17 TaxID=3144404 RepID=UPI0031F5BBA5
MHPLPIPELIPALRVIVELGELEDHGRTVTGHRRVVPITGGSVEGDFTGRILTGGADWQIVRDDGTIEIDSRYSAVSSDGDLLHIRAAGIRTGEPGVLAALGRGEELDPSSYYFRTNIQLESSDPELANRLYIGACARHRSRVVYTAYRVT